MRRFATLAVTLLLAGPLLANDELPSIMVQQAPVTTCASIPVRVVPLRARLHHPRPRVHAATTSAPVAAATTSAPVAAPATTCAPPAVEVSTCAPKEVVAPATTCSASMEAQPVLVVPVEPLRLQPLRATGCLLHGLLHPWRNPLLPGGALIWAVPERRLDCCNP